MIRHRRWEMFDPIQNSEHILVNILPLDEQSRGNAGFRQTREHEYSGKRRGQPRERKHDRAHSRPLRLTLEQESLDAWWVSLDELNCNHFPPQWCRSFIRSFRSCIDELSKRPLELVLQPPISLNPPEIESVGWNN